MKGHRAQQAREKRHLDVAFALVIFAGLIAVAVMALWVQNLSRDLKTSNDARDALARQVQQLGEKPVAGPPGSRGEAGKSVVGPSGPPGPSGSPGRNGRDGRNGKPGPSGSPGVDGASVTGDPGSSGASGAPGVPGPAGPAGPQGEPGPAGKDGADGSDGKDGQTCPDGYSLQAPSYDPDALVCRKDGSGDPPEQPSPSNSAVALDPLRRVYR